MQSLEYPFFGYFIAARVWYNLLWIWGNNESRSIHKEYPTSWYYHLVMIMISFANVCTHLHCIIWIHFMIKSCVSFFLFITFFFDTTKYISYFIEQMSQQRDFQWYILVHQVYFHSVFHKVVASGDFLRMEDICWFDRVQLLMAMLHLQWSNL